MEQIIQERINNDSDKFVRTSLVENLSTLEKIAFSMQVKQTTTLTADDFSNLFPDKEIKKIQYIGLITTDQNGSLRFEHNNFREYLTAKYLLNNLDKDEIQTLVFTDNNTVKKSYIHVLSYMIILQEDATILKYIIEHDPCCVIQFDKTRISSSIRVKIVIDILDSSAEKCLFINEVGLNAIDVGFFGESDKLLTNLLTRIKNPRNSYDLSNALYVLNSFTTTFYRDDEIRNILFSLIKSDTTNDESICLCYDEDVYLQLLRLPNHCFETFLNSYITVQGISIPSYLLNHLSSEKISSQIKFLFDRSDTICDKVKLEFLHYCMENKLNYAVPYAEQLCLDNNQSFYYEAIDYIFLVCGYRYVCEKFLETDNSDLLCIIISKIMVIEDADDILKMLKEKIEEKIQTTDKPELFLSFLIEMNSEAGLKKYFEIITKNNSTIGNYAIMPFTERCFASIHDVSLLNIIDDIRRVRYSYGFKDTNFCTLQDSLYKAYCNIAKSEPEIVAEHMHTALKSKEITDSERSFCNLVLVTIKDEIENAKDKHMNNRDIWKFWKEHNL